MSKFSKYKLNQTNLFTPKKVFRQLGEDGKPEHFSAQDLIASGMPEDELERHLELGTIVGLEGAEIEEKPKGESKEEPKK